MGENKIPEFAFIGRSNVGKSSLINMLTGQKALAKTSSTPGKTQSINRFLINESWYLVDLPGYGYAKVSKKSREKFGDMIMRYMLERKQLITAFVLVDIRIDPQKIDLEFMEWCGLESIPFQIIFTKADKIKASQVEMKLEIYRATLHANGWQDFPAFFISSSNTQQGKDEISAYLDSLIPLEM